VIAMGASSVGGKAEPAAPPPAILDPAAVPTTTGTAGSNLIGECPDDGAARPRYEEEHGIYSILTGVANCPLSTVAGDDLISAWTSVRETEYDDAQIFWLKTTVTNESENTLAFDLASPTLMVTVPEDSHWFHQIGVAERPLHNEETWESVEGVESWGGSGSPRGGIGDTATPRIDGAPQPGIVWNLVLQRPQDEGMHMSTSRGSVTLAPGQSFVFESSISVFAIAATDEAAAEAMVALFNDPSRLAASVYVSLQADALGGAPKSLLVDAAVPLERVD
jgi:hypothetical protein